MARTSTLLSEPARDRRDLAGSLTLALGWIFVTAFGLYLSPDPMGHGTHQHLGLPPCPSVMLFDRPCPGCGLTTSWTATIHGNLPLAFRAHALGPFLYWAYTLFALGTFALFLRRRRWREMVWTNRVLVGVFVVFAGYGLIRMALTPHYASRHERLLRSFASVRS